MAEKARHFKLGLFFLMSIGLLVVGVVFLGLMDYFRPTYTVETYFIDQPVRGLDIGAPVKMEGVPVGKVTEIDSAALVYRKDEVLRALQTGDMQRIAATEFRTSVLVRMKLRPHASLRDIGDLRKALFQHMVDNGLRVQLAQSGLTGPAFIDMVYLDPELHPVPEIPWQPEYIFVPSARSTIAVFEEAATEIINRLRKTDFTATFERLEETLRALNELAGTSDLAGMHANITAFTEDVRRSSRRLREFLEDPRLEQGLNDLAETASGTRSVFAGRANDLGSALEAIPRVAERLELAATRAESLLEDQRIDGILEGMSVAAGSAGETMQNAEETTAELRRLVRELNSLTMVLNEDLNVVTENLRRITEDAEIITGEIKDNPSRLIFGKEPRRSSPGKSNRQEEKP